MLLNLVKNPTFGVEIHMNYPEMELTLEQFLLQIPTQLGPQDRVLLAVSGGVDSMVLLDLFRQSGIQIAVAHANFGLRAEASDADERCVKEYCVQYNIPFYGKFLDVATYQNSHNASIQMAARTLRYQWFSSLMENENFNYLATAHHLQDSVETFFINLTRGTGINGLVGIKNNENQILRPLLPFAKQAILAYAIQAQIPWREDASNQKLTYHRNKIRHQVIPVLEEVHPQFLENMQKTMRQIKGVEDLVRNQMDYLKNKLFQKETYCQRISVEDLQQLKPLDTYLYYLFAPYGFSKPQELIHFLSAQNSAELTSETHRLVMDRGFWLLSVVEPFYENKSYEITTENSRINEPFDWEFCISNEPSDKSLVSFDAKIIKFPLLLRKPQTGDVFCPKGMKGKQKKVSKFFKDNKFHKFEKENTFLLCNGHGEIMWVVGHRADERFLPNEKTTKWLHVKEI